MKIDKRNYFINYKFSNYTGTETIDKADNNKAIKLLKEHNYIIVDLEGQIIRKEK